MIQLLERLGKRSARVRLTRLLGLGVLGATLLGAPASTSATPADTAATHALLRAQYEFYLALVRDAPAGRANAVALSERLGRECHGVLASVPKDAPAIGPEHTRPTPRQRGESQRAARQSFAIEAELGATLGAADAQPDRPAIEAYVATATPLSWSDARIAPLVHANVATLQESAPAAPPDVCADMKAWAESGYHRLSPSSQTFLTRLATSLERGDDEGTLTALLKPYEGAAERTLLRRIEGLRMKFALTRVKKLSGFFSQLQHALGVPEGPGEERRHAPVLGHGTTHAGSTYTVQPETTKGPRTFRCPHAVSVEFTSRLSRGNFTGIVGSSGPPVCLSARGRRPTITCDEGTQTITAAVPGNVNTVQLRLSDRATFTSRVVRVPRKDGGPAGIYAQAIRGYGSHPVSLTELDRQGHVVSVVPLRNPHCKRERHPVEPKPLTLVHGIAPGGEPFTIEGTLKGFLSPGRSFSVSARADDEPFGSDDEGEIEIGGSGPPKAFPWSRAMGCAPHPFALVYGILAPPGDSVLARTPEGLVPLTKLELAPDLHAQGPLVYGAFAALPSELIVRRSDGSTLYAESLTAKAAEDAEFCEGLAEG